MLKGKSIIVGVTGSVAAYKAIDLVKGLRCEDASVSVIMTGASQRFITPLSLQIASQNTVYTDMFEHPLSHISLPAGADLMIVAPASANCIGKYASAIADDMLSTTLLAFNGPVILAPAMNWRMYENPILRKQLDYLVSLGVKTVGPERGSLACGEEGIGRMAEVDSILESAEAAVTPQDLRGENVLVTAGPTREHLDPVRFLSNRSSGKMGYALAKVAKRRGAEVTLVSGPVSLKPPPDIKVTVVETALEMRNAVMDNIKEATIFVMCAAVADFSPGKVHEMKIEKTESLSLNLRINPDILLETSALEKRPFTVGFSAETGDHIDRAKKKLTGKKADMIVFNDVSKKGSGFDVDTNEVTIIDIRGEKALAMMTKTEVASAIFDRIGELRKR
ncbi:MAG TPA: bifunctional phosphopantothenoylcysteine decarboxylase/phosphopantothenate--cysteine ligase CoaBC [Dissulfurispiraceae bacterium]|nr:bifunctional phosphopantothenoylcysteine decarboxylase/phosphopantothenate--cysteine ligase CoaBC [Dissulfurispiraceae bacterium]